MILTGLEARDLRILGAVAAKPAAGLNVLAGPNGSGKTSLLEAVHLLGTGRSFRTRYPGELVRRGTEGFLVRGVLSDGTSVGLEHGDGRTRIRSGGRDVARSSDLARRLPLVVLSPDSHRLLTDGSALRRGLVDWAMFHVEPGYGEWHARYRRALRQRNRILREGGGSASLAPWDRELSEAGEVLHRMRRAYMETVLPAFERFVATLVPIDIEVRFDPGWDDSRSLDAVLAGAIDGDRQRGYTRLGPHRADLRLQATGRPAKDVVSRGEGKLLVCGLVLAQAAYLVETVGATPVVLVDELASELDVDSRGRVFDALASLRVQSFVTTVSEALVSGAHLSTARVFHVERGALREVV